MGNKAPDQISCMYEIHRQPRFSKMTPATTGPMLLATRKMVTYKSSGTVRSRSPSQMLPTRPAVVLASTETQLPEKKRETTSVAKFWATACGIRKSRKTR
jgi:hypothetical protein